MIQVWKSFSFAVVLRNSNLFQLSSYFLRRKRMKTKKCKCAEKFNQISPSFLVPSYVTNFVLYIFSLHKKFPFLNVTSYKNWNWNWTFSWKSHKNSLLMLHLFRFFPNPVFVLYIYIYLYTYTLNIPIPYTYFVFTIYTFHLHII